MAGSLWWLRSGKGGDSALLGCIVPWPKHVTQAGQSPGGVGMGSGAAHLARGKASLWPLERVRVDMAGPARRAGLQGSPLCGTPGAFRHPLGSRSWAATCSSVHFSLPAGTSGAERESCVRQCEGHLPATALCKAGVRGSAQARRGACAAVLLAGRAVGWGGGRASGRQPGQPCQLLPGLAA